MYIERGWMYMATTPSRSRGSVIRNSKPVKTKEQTEKEKKIKSFIKYLKEQNYRVLPEDYNIKTCSMQLSDKCKKDHDNPEKLGRRDSEFFVVNNDKLFKARTVHICKDCIKDYVYKENGEVDLVKFKKILLMLDVPFISKDFESACANKSDTIGTYFRGIYLNYSGNSWDDGEIEQFEIIKEESIRTEKEVRFFWGRGFNDYEYEWLENEYYDWANKYECDSKGMILLIKQICLQELDIEKRRSNGEKVDAQLKTLQDLLGSSNLKPVQETGANSTEQATFGTLVKKYENEKPVPPPLPAWLDANWIKKYFSVWFLGHLCKMMGVNNEYSDMYEEEIAKYTVSPPDDNIIEEDD